jgi:tetratricopeptide (TPR) repeat protein
LSRCPTCGARLESSRACPRHGPAPSPAPPSGEEEAIEIAGFRIDRVLGVGGFGQVLSAWRAADGRKVAIKVPRRDRPTAVLRFPREVHALRIIGPPHVPELLETGRLRDGRPYLVMEFLDHPTLAERLAQRPERTRVTDVGRQAMAVLEALGAAHACGLIHRDLSPENIFLDDRPRARLVDFGLVKRDAPLADTPNPLTTENTIVGTAEYMAPEQCLGTTVDARTDIYSLGVILFEMLAGVPPFWGQAAVVQQKHVSARPPRLPPRIAVGCEALAEVVDRCLAKNPAKRFQNVPALAEALAAALADCPPNLDLPVPDAAVRPRRATNETASVPARERRRIGLVFLRSQADAVALKRTFAELAGQVVHAAGDGLVAGFGHDAAESPAQRALEAAHAAIDRGFALHATVDLCPVTVRPRLDGSLRFLTPVAADDDRFPGPADPRGVLVTRAAAEMLPDLRGMPLVDRPGMLLLRRSAASRQSLHRAIEPLVGRDEVVRSILASARASLGGRRTAVVVVTGESGQGKTHLAAEITDQLAAQVPEAEVFDIRAREPIDGDADRTTRGLLRRALGLAPSVGHREARAAVVQALGPQLADLAWPPLALVMGWIGPEAGELRRIGAAPGALRATVARATGEILRRRAARRPLVLILDDAQFADDASLDALEYAALAEADLPIWVCALGRPAFAAARAGFGDRSSRRLAIDLGPLEPPALAELCRRLLLPAEGIPADALDRLVNRAQGNPLLLVELVRGLKRDGVVRTGERGWYLATDELDRMPDLPLVEWLAQRELDALPVALAAHARLASLISPELTADEVDGVLARLPRDEVMQSYPLDAGVSLERLVMTGLMTLKGQSRFAFRHALVREAVALTVSPEARQRIHRAAFEHYRDAADIPDERRGPLVAEHAAKAGLSRQAAEAYLGLAARSSQRHAYLDAETLYSRALDHLAPAERQGAWRGRGQMRYRLGRFRDALDDFARARVEARGDRALEAELLLDEATALDWASDFPGSQERVERALELAEGDRPPVLEAKLLLARGRSLNRQSRDQEASELLERAAALAQAVGDEGYETHVVSLLMLGWILIGLGRLDEAARALERGLAVCEERGDRMHLLTALNNRGLLAACREDQAEMAASFERVRSLAHELGLTVMELYAEYNLAESLYLLGVDSAQAAVHIERARALVERRLAGSFRPVIQLLEARLFAHAGDLAAARDRIEVIRQHQREARRRPELLFVPSEEALFTMVELAVSGAEPAAWDALEARAAEVSVGQERIEVVEMRGLAALRAGRIEEGRAALARAQALAASIPNAMRRRLAQAVKQAG